MAKTYIRAAENTYETGVSGGTVPTANKIIKVVNWMKRLEPYETPLLSTIGYGEAIDQDVFYWGQSYQTPQKSTAAEPMDNSETDLTVAAGNGTYFSKYNVIMMVNFVAGSNNTRLDLTNKELAWVSADPSTDTLTIVRGVGGTAAVTHDTGCHVEIVGNAMPQLTDFAITPITRGDQAYNYFQRFQTAAQADRMARHQPNHENKSDILLDDMAEKARIEKIRLEKALFFGGRQRGVPGTSPMMMGGLDTYITTNVTNVGGITMNTYVLQDELRDLYKTVGSPPSLKFIMGPDTAGLFDTLPNPYRETDFSNTNVNLMLNKVKTRFGVIEVLMHRYCPEGVVYGVDFDKMKVHPFAGGDWQTKELETQGPYDKLGLSGEFSFRLEAEHTMFKVYGFDTNPDSYQRGEFL